ncbi:MAG TPA: hypothetical protein VFE53_26650 [Mucilaginibacter sp.]|jgi:hypothetical protein|nr:hypothetical protein [Mucilaginibacter sp.]
MKKLFILSFSIFLTSQLFAQQTATDSIKQTINTLLDAIRKGDSTLSISVLSKGMIKQRISNDKNGKAILSTKYAGDLVKAIGTPHAVVYDERIVYDVIKIDGDLACVWAPYKFYFGDQFSYCGVDVFQLMRTADGWKVIYVMDTERKNNCTP